MKACPSSQEVSGRLELERAHRRHLNESQRAMVADKLTGFGHGGDRKSEKIKGSNDLLITQKEAAGLLNVSVPSVKRAHVVRESGADAAGYYACPIAGRIAAPTTLPRHSHQPRPAPEFDGAFLCYRGLNGKGEVMGTEEHSDRCGQLARRLFMGTGAVVLVLVGVVAGYSSAAHGEALNEEVRARRIVLLDERGTARAILGMDTNGPALKLLDEKGGPHAILGLADGTPGLSLFDKKGRRGALLGVVERGPGLTLVDEKSKVRASLSLDEGGSRLTLSDDKGTDRSVLGLEKGRPHLNLFDEEGIPHAAIGVTNGTPGLILTDKKSKSHISLAATEDGPAVVLLDENRVVRASMTISERRPALRLYEEKGKTNVILIVTEQGPGLFLSDKKGNSRTITP